MAQITPPSPLVGAHRPAALARYLERRGDRVTVLTSIASGRGGVAGAAHVLRTRDLLSSRLNWRRSHLEVLQGQRQATYGEASPIARLVVPDLSLIGWIPFALPRALALARRGQFDCVITTSPPQSAHLIGYALRLTGVRWIADLRDGWTFDAPRPPWPTRLQDSLDASLERGLLRKADRVVAVTTPIARDLERRLRRPVAVITNGFDPHEHAAEGAPALDPQRHSLVHTGRLNVVGRSPQAFFDGLHEFLRRRPDGFRDLEVVLAGPISAEQRRLLADPRLDHLVRSVGSLDRPAALALQRRADTLLVLAEGNDLRSARTVATGKLFEYLGARRPVLVLGRDSEAARIVTSAAAGMVVGGGDAGEIASALELLADGGLPAPAGAVDAYSWPALAERWEQEIESLFT